jgi:hypothetical protein
MVLASNTLSQVQLEAELDSMDDLFDYRYRFVPDTHYSMSAVIKNVYIVYADTWRVGPRQIRRPTRASCSIQSVIG